MRTLYCIGRIIEMREGYAAKQGDERPRIIKLSMEPNPYTPSFTLEIALAQHLYDGMEVGDRIKVTLAKSTDEEWRAFQERTSTPMAVPA